MLYIVYTIEYTLEFQSACQKQKPRKGYFGPGGFPEVFLELEAVSGIV